MIHLPLLIRHEQKKCQAEPWQGLSFPIVSSISSASGGKISEKEAPVYRVYAKAGW